MSGKALWEENGISVCVHPAGQSDQVVTADVSGGAFVVWQDFRNRGNNVDIYAQRIDAQGRILWAADGIPICTATGTQMAPAIIADDANGAIIAWLDISAECWNILVQRIDSNGKAIWHEPVMVAAADESKGELRMISDGLGGAIIIWQVYENYISDNIFAQRISPKGERLWGDNGIVACEADGIQKHPAVVSDTKGGAVMAWADERDIFSDIYAQRISANGEVKWQKDGVPVCTAGEHQGAPSIVNDKKGDVIIVWRDYREDYEDMLNDAIYAQKLTLDGVAVWTADGVSLCSADREHRTPATVSDEGGGAIVIWSDGRNDLGDIFMQRIKGK